MIGIASSSAPSLCPASARSAVNKLENWNSWRYVADDEWYEGDITVTCDTKDICESSQYCYWTSDYSMNKSEAVEVKCISCIYQLSLLKSYFSTVLNKVVIWQKLDTDWELMMRQYQLYHSQH